MTPHTPIPLNEGIAAPPSTGETVVVDAVNSVPPLSRMLS
jgi:hypothetical protein